MWNAKAPFGSKAVPAHGLRKTPPCTVEIVRARTAKKSAKPEEPNIEGKKSERYCEYDVACGSPEQDQRADFPWVLRIVVDIDLITGVHDGHAYVTAAPLPGIRLSINNVFDRSTGVGKGVLCAAKLGHRLAKVLRLHHSNDCLWPGGLLDNVGRVNVNAGGDDDDAVNHNGN